MRIPAPNTPATPARNVVRHAATLRGQRALRRAMAGSNGLALALAVAAAGFAVRGEAAEQLVEGIAAQVGNEIVLVSEVMELAAPVEERMRAGGVGEQEIQRVRIEALDRLIEGKLLSSVVERAELGAEREEIDAAISGIAEDNGISVDDLYKSIQSHGLTVDEYRKKIQGEIERSKVVNAMVRAKVEVSDEEVRKLYEERFAKQPTGGDEVFLRHIVVRSGGETAADGAEACARIEAARAEIAAGGEFQTVARKYTEMNPEREGELGWIHHDELAPWMETAIAKLHSGELTPAIEMPFGCNLLQLVDRRSFKPVSFDDAQPQLRNLLFQQKTEAEYVKWIDVLRQQTHIEKKGAFGG